MYIIKLSIHENDRPHGIVNSSVDMIISIIFSFRVQLLFNDKVLIKSSVILS